MTEQPQRPDIEVIDLLRAETARTSAPPPPAVPTASPPPTTMTMRQLQDNFGSILRARAIFYPIAYQFPKRLGRGRQGVVFLGLRQGARGCITEHAIKVMDPSLYRSPEEYWTDMGRIAMQISQLQRLQSPNLVSRHVYEETYGIGYIEMPSEDGSESASLHAPSLPRS